MAVTIYTTPNCPACDHTKRWMERRGISYEVMKLSDSVAVMEFAAAQGFTAAPVVIAGAESWSGFRPDLIDKIGGDHGA